MGILTPHRGTHIDTPISWVSLPHTRAHSVPSQSQRGTTHPSHGHTQLMGSLTGQITQFVSWRMSHKVVIIKTLLSTTVKDEGYSPSPTEIGQLVFSAPSKEVCMNTSSVTRQPRLSACRETLPQASYIQNKLSSHLFSLLHK
jgi:hypothetical protein